MHGIGVYTWPAIQQCYTGQWKDGKRHGHGRHYFHSSSPDEVGYDDDDDDQPCSTVAGGDYYDGEWKEGVMHGEARYVDAGGEEHEGLWVDGVCPEVVRGEKNRRRSSTDALTRKYTTKTAIRPHKNLRAGYIKNACNLVYEGS